MCQATNFEMKSKSKNFKGNNKRVPKRVPISSLEQNCSFEDRSNKSCIKRNYKESIYD